MFIYLVAIYSYCKLNELQEIKWYMKEYYNDEITT